MTPAYGHSLCALPIIKSLVQAGYEVECYTSPIFKKYIVSCNAKYYEYDMDFSTIRLDEITSDLYRLTKALTSLNRQLFLRYEEEIKKNPPELIIYDSMCSFAKNIATKFGIKSTCIVSTIGFNGWVCTFSSIGTSSVPLVMKNMSSLREILREENQFRKQNGLHRLNLIDLFMNKADQTIVLTPKEFQPFSRTFPKNVHFVGTTIKEQISILKGETEYHEYDIFMSMGTVFTDKISECVGMFEREEIIDKKCLVLSGKDIGQKLPDNVEIANWVNQLDLLPHCKSIINQAGANTVYAAMYFGIPQICIPHQEEERQMAKIVRRYGCGIYMKKYNTEEIINSIKRLPFVKVDKCMQIVRKYDGTQNAIDIILDQLGG